MNIAQTLIEWSGVEKDQILKGRQVRNRFADMGFKEPQDLGEIKSGTWAKIVTPAMHGYVCIFAGIGDSGRWLVNDEAGSLTNPSMPMHGSQVQAFMIRVLP